MQKFYFYYLKEVLASAMLILLLIFSNQSRAALAAGDIAVIGYNSDGATTTKDFAVVTLAKINPGETIYITDKGWTATSGGSFMADITTEGVFSWTTNTAIPRGTVIRFAISAGASPTVASTPSVGTLNVINGWTSTATASPFGTNGDQVIIYQGSVASPTFVFGFNAGNNSADLVGGWQTTATSGNSFSNLPTGLTNGTNAVSFVAPSGILDNYVYNGDFTGDKATILAQICNTSKWVGDDANTYNLVPGDAAGRFPGTNPIFSAAPVASAVAITGTLKVGQALTGTYNYSDADGDAQSGSSFKWYRADNAAGLNKTAIALATAQSYVAAVADENKYLSFEVTPSDGGKNGIAVESSFNGPVLPVVLPVELTDFAARVVFADQVRLDWKVASEQNNNHFEILRKGDDGEFKSIGTVLGRGTIGTSQIYFFQDSKPLLGKNYYRLQQVDNNGTAKTIGEKLVLFEVSTTSLKAYPNPAVGIARVNVTKGKFQSAELLDLRGKLTSRQSISDQQQELVLDLGTFPAGVYFIHLKGRSASERIKVVKSY